MFMQNIRRLKELKLAVCVRACVCAFICVCVCVCVFYVFLRCVLFLKIKLKKHIKCTKLTYRYDHADVHIRPSCLDRAKISSHDTLRSQFGSKYAPAIHKSLYRKQHLQWTQPSSLLIDESTRNNILYRSIHWVSTPYMLIFLSESP